MVSLLLLFGAGLVAFANGANANFKGVASLYGSGTTSYRVAVWWANATTAMGSATALLVGTAMLKAFSGKGLVPDTLAGEPSFLLAVALGAGTTNLLATWLGFPVSTTHMLIGALLGAGLVPHPEGIHWQTLGNSFLAPLLVSPFLAVAVGALLFGASKRMRLAPDHRTPVLDLLHFLSGGAVCFARGLNDTPKIAALLIPVAWMGQKGGLLFAGGLIVLGGLIAARRVAETLSHKITDLNPGEGFAANLATSLLVTTASLHGLPVSTTHVSVGSLLGIGISTRQAKWKTVIPVLAAWVITLPCAALVSALFQAIAQSYF